MIFRAFIQKVPTECGRSLNPSLPGRIFGLGSVRREHILVIWILIEPEIRLKVQ